LRFTSQNPLVVDRIMAVTVPLEVGSVNAKLRNGVVTAELLDMVLQKDQAADPARVDALKADPQAISNSFAVPDSFKVGRIDNPCLLVYGQGDQAITNPEYRPEEYPYNTHMMFLEQAGHFPMLEDSARFNRLLTDFLALQSGETPRELQMKEEWKRRVR
jgi:pimeloyl-ACP methyl ester carboxylesterase